MIIKGLTQSDLQAIIDHVNAGSGKGNIEIDGSAVNPKLNNAGTRFRVKLRVKLSKGKFGRRSHSGRRIAALCWHGFRDVLMELFDRFPDAKVSTAYAVYDGRQGFLDKFPGTGQRNIGSVMEPMTAASACDCW